MVRGIGHHQICLCLLYSLYDLALGQEERNGQGCRVLSCLPELAQPVEATGCQFFSGGLEFGLTGLLSRLEVDLLLLLLLLRPLEIFLSLLQDLQQGVICLLHKAGLGHILDIGLADGH